MTYLFAVCPILLDSTFGINYNGIITWEGCDQHDEETDFGTVPEPVFAGWVSACCPSSWLEGAGADGVICCAGRIPGFRSGEWDHYRQYAWNFRGDDPGRN